MMSTLEVVLALAAASGIGYMFGVLRRDVQWLALCQSQQERGDYWFEKYMSEVREDWETVE